MKKEEKKDDMRKSMPMPMLREDLPCKHPTFGDV